MSRLTTTARATAALLIAAGALAAGASYAQVGRTTAGGTIGPIGPLDAAKPGFAALGLGPPSVRVVRELPRAKAQSNRSKRRRSLAYFAQLTDFQLADEESPARIELFDRRPTGLYSWRPQEALMPFVIDESLRQLSAFTAASPNKQRRGTRAAMDFALISGDQSDNQQLNENEWARDLVEGGKWVDPNSGVSDYSGCKPVDQTALAGRPADEAKRYTGVQDYDDYEGGNGSGSYYDPDTPAGLFTQWPGYPGLMDRAERPFVPHGLTRGGSRIRTYVANGNHDGGVQGNVPAGATAEKLAIGCFKPFSTNPPPGIVTSAAFALSEGFAVPPDPERRFADRNELKRVYSHGSQADGHGFGFVDPAQDKASAFTASYYAFDPKPGLKFISLDTVSEGGASIGSPSGNIDDPQWRWLNGELQRAKAERRLVVLFGHHPTRSLVSGTPDEAAGACSGSYNAAGQYSGPPNAAGIDHGAGCDLDPRVSAPIHLGADVISLFNVYPNVIAYVAGHSHSNRVLACGKIAGCPKSGNWWEITTSSVADWPQQQRLIEVMDNADGTASIIGTPVDHAGPTTVPPPGTPASGMTTGQLAALGRSFSFNDPQVALADAGGERDRDVELIVRDPRQGKGAGLCAVASKSPKGKKVDRAVLGRTRTAIRRSYPKASLTRKRSATDTFCLVGGGTVRAGYRPGSKRAAVLLSARKTHRLRGIRPGSSERAVRRRLRGARPIRVGSVRWYLARSGSARIVVRVRRGKAVEIGLADRRLTASRKAAKRLLAPLR